MSSSRLVIFARRRRREGGAKPDPLGAGNTALIAALGGNSAVLGFYDVRKNVTVATGTVSQWDDVRGSSGFAPSLVQATGANRPAWDGTNLLISSAGGTETMSTASVALFNAASGITLVVVGSFSAGAESARLCTLSTSSETAVYSSATRIAAHTSGGLAVSTVALSATRRLIFAASGGAAPTAIVEIPNTAQVTNGTALPTAGNNTLTLFKNGGAPSPTGSVRAILVLSGVYTTPQRDTLKTWATTYHGAVLV